MLTLPTCSTLMDVLTEGLYCVDRQRRITFWNPAAERLTGYAAAEVMGKSCADNILRHVDDAGNNLCDTVCPLASTILDGQDRAAMVYLHHRQGHRVPVNIRCIPVRTEAGKTIGALELFSEISPLESLRQRLANMEALAYLDALTEVANRRMLEQTLYQRLAEWQRTGRPFGVMMADIDHFKSINDTHGHLTGDQVLRMVAQTMAHNCRAFDTVGRWGGDEFVGVFPHVDILLFTNLVDRLSQLIHTAFLPLAGARRLHVSISAGMTLVRSDDTLESLLQRADQALLESKAGGRDRVTISSS